MSDPQRLLRDVRARAAPRARRARPVAGRRRLAGGDRTLLWESADGRILRGIWRITEGTVTDVEQDELFVVLEGSATIEVEHGPTLEVGADDVCVLEAGARTTWTAHEALRKVFQITLPPTEGA